MSLGANLGGGGGFNPYKRPSTPGATSGGPSVKQKPNVPPTAQDVADHVSTLGAGEFAFVCHLDKCHYAFSDGRLPAISVLVQSCADRGIGKLWLRDKTIYHSYDRTQSLVDRGIIKKQELTRFEQVQRTDAPGPEAVSRAKGAFSFRQRTSLARRDDLDQFELTGLDAQHLGQNFDLHTTSGPKGQGWHTVHRVYMMAAYALCSRVDRHAAELAEGEPVGAIIARRDGQVVGWGVNTNGSNYTFHAEVNAVQAFLKQNGAADANAEYVIFTTLEPCAMCAGVIKWAFGDRVRVYYNQTDPSTAHMDSTILGTASRRLDGSPLNGNQATPKPISAGIKLASDKPNASPRVIAVQAKGQLTELEFPEENWEIDDEDNVTIKTISTHQVSNMASFISSCYSTLQPRPKVLDFLNGALAIHLMRRAGRRLKEKKLRYEHSRQNDNTQSRKAIEYLYPFLRERGVKGFD